MNVDINHIVKGESLEINEPSLYKLFLQSVQKYPHKAALYFGKQSMTYSELNELVDRIAIGIYRIFGEEKMNIAFCVERSFIQIAGILAIIKTGHICVPISSAYPPNRIADVCSQVHCKAIIHDDSLKPSDFSSHYNLYEIRSLEDSTNDSDLTTERFSENAFVVFTSGSTGRPKGVWLSQKAIVNCLIWRRDLCNVTNDDVFLYKAPITFDISIWEIFLPLLNGASVVIANPIGHYVVSYLINTIEKRKVTIIQFVGSILRKFLDEAEASQCSSLRAIFCGGESWNFELGKKVFEYFPNIELFNVYGQTETSLGSSGWKFDPEYKRLTIGKPNYNAEYLIISDDQNSIDGMEEAGELYVGGGIVSDGYVNNHAETEKSFRTIQTSFQTLGRFYKTGDYVKRLPDGNFVFLGRKDNQVKIYGVRVELEEIENLVNDIEGIKASAAIKAGTEEDAYVVLYIQTDLNTDPQLIIQHCRKYLPAVMVPRKILMLPEIPITVNGKVDRKQLKEQYESNFSV